MIQWLGLHATTAISLGSFSSMGTKIPQAEWHGQNLFFFFLKREAARESRQNCVQMSTDKKEEGKG